MLTAHSSANTSPNTFRHAPSQSPHAVARELTEKLRKSSSSASSPSLAMHEPMTAAVRPAASASASATATATTGTSANLAPGPDGSAPSSNTSTTMPAEEDAPKDPAPTAAVPDELLSSPVKRRGKSPDFSSGDADITNQGDDGQRSKRHRADSQPAKTLPLRYDLCPVEDMVELIAHMLSELIGTNDAIRTSTGGLTRFHSRTAPGISVRDYLHRLAKHATLTPPLLLVMVYYIDRLCAMYPEFTINTLTVHRFLITAATVAAKGLSDSFWNNTTYARVGGVRLAELKLLELEFLYRVDWKIVPNPDVLVAYYQGLVERTPGYTIEAEDGGADDIDEA